MKKIYFVRHAESESNATGVHRGATARLTVKGKLQAEQVACRFKAIPFDVVVSSEYPRAYETAEVIAKESGKRHEVLKELHERIRSSECVGKASNDPVRIRIETEYFKKLDADVRNYQFSDEETFEDLFVRARVVKEELEARTESRIVAVTHGTFLRFLHAYLVFGESLTPKIFLAILNSHKTSNTGITIYEVQEAGSKEKEGWRLRTWMDVAHLGE